jgi:hypothetical protein
MPKVARVGSKSIKTHQPIKIASSGSTDLSLVEV